MVVKIVNKNVNNNNMILAKIIIGITKNNTCHKIKIIIMY